MRINDKMILRHVGKDYIIVEPEKDTVDMTKVYSLNKTAAWLWEELKGMDFSEEMVADLIMNKYGITKEQTLEDARKLIDGFKEQGLIL